MKLNKSGRKCLVISFYLISLSNSKSYILLLSYFNPKNIKKIGLPVLASMLPKKSSKPTKAKFGRNRKEKGKEAGFWWSCLRCKNTIQRLTLI